MTENSSSPAETSDEAAAESSGNNAGEWAKTVADGAANAAAPPPAPLGDVSPDDDLSAGNGGGSDGAAADSADDIVIDAEVLDEESNVADQFDAAEGGDNEAAAAANPDGAAGNGDPVDLTSVTVEDLVLDLERVTTERDQYLDASRRLQAEFENYKKQVGKRETTARERANDSLISELLPVMDAFDGALANGAEDVAPMRTTFLDALAKLGLERIDPVDDAFDPTLHEAVMHEDAADVDGPVVAEVMRAGYAWKGRVLRPAMVRTRG